MTTFDTLLDPGRMDRITSEAREVHFTRTMLTALAGFLWLVGWSVAKVFAVAWFAVAWMATAVRLGWSDARPTQPRN
jgi:hypothetical protein